MQAVNRMLAAALFRSVFPCLMILFQVIFHGRDTGSRPDDQDKRRDKDQQFYVVATGLYGYISRLYFGPIFASLTSKLP